MYRRADLSRRSILRNGALLAALPLLAACGAGTSATTATSSAAVKSVSTASAATSRAAATAAVPTTTGRAASVAMSRATGRASGKAATVWVYDAFGPYLDLRTQLDTLVYKPFAVSNPQITVKHDSVSSGDFYKKVPVLFAGGAAPDLLWVQTFAHYSFINENLTLDLTPLTARDKQFDLPDFWKPALSNLSQGGKLYGLPYNMQVIAIFCNLDLFQKAGLGLPKDGWTWQDFADMGKKLTNLGGPTKVFGALPLGGGAWQLESFLLHSGGSVLNKDRNAPALDSPGSIQAIQWMTDLRLKDQIAPYNGNPMEKGKGFDTGNGAMLVSDLTVRETLKKKPDLKYDLVPLPKGPVNNFSITGGGAYWISRTSKVSNVAFQLMTALLSKEAAPAYGNTGIPGRQSASSILTSPGMPPAHIQVVLDEMKTAPGPTWGEHPQNLAIWHAYGPSLQKAFDGVTDVRSAVAATQQAVAAAMQKTG